MCKGEDSPEGTMFDRRIHPVSSGEGGTKLSSYSYTPRSSGFFVLKVVSRFQDRPWLDKRLNDNIDKEV